MLHAATHNESIPCAQFEQFSLAGRFQMPAHNVDNLIVRVAVHRPSPTFDHLVLDEKELVVVGEHAARKAAFRMGFFGLVTWRDYKVGISLALRLHFCASYSTSFSGALGFGCLGVPRFLDQLGIPRRQIAD